MNNYDYIRLYKNTINPSYFGLPTLINNLLSEHNINEKQIGGVIKKFSVDNQEIKADVVYNKDFEEISIQIMSLIGNEECGVIIIYRENPTTAIIGNIQGKDTCYQSTIDKTNNGKIIMKLLIDLCKFYQCNKIKLADNAIKKLGDYSFNMSMYYTMIKGYPWYCQFGFKNSYREDQEKIIKNYHKLHNKKVKDFNKNIFIDKQFIDIYDKYIDENIKDFIKLLSTFYVKNFFDTYQNIYINLGLEFINSKNYQLLHFVQS